MENNSFFGTEKIWKLLIRLAPPVMLAQLIQAVYSIVDSYFVGKYSGEGLTAISVIFPLQLIIIALAVGTGVGVNTLVSRYSAQGRENEGTEAEGTGVVLAVVSWVILALISTVFMKPYVKSSANSYQVVEYGVIYGKIVCIGSLGIFVESMFSKIHQAEGNMSLPMIAQIVGAVINVVLDPIMIFGFGICPKMGIAGAALATVIGQTVAAVITGAPLIKRGFHIKRFSHHVKYIYKLGYPSICMQMLYTVYITILNIILAGFSDDAVTVLGLYYKLQIFFFIPIMALQTCIVPILSYNHAAGKRDRCNLIMRDSFIIAGVLMLIGTFCFEFIPGPLIRIFSHSEGVLSIGKTAFRLIGLSFLPGVFSWILPVYFQAMGKSLISVSLSLLRQIICLAPIFWLLSKIGLAYTWLAFPLSEIISGGAGLLLYFRKER